jgi:hypothetical protein
MMPNVVRGSQLPGLMRYLVGPGRANEHTEPHLVAGDGALMAWHGDAELAGASALRIARHLDRPRVVHDREVKGGHVWHCSLSLRAEEGSLSDERWAQIATDFVSAMEFDDNQGTKAPCRWVAVRHGLSGGGNDHIHLVVNLVREDGTRASVHNDFRRAQAAARALEAKHGLEGLESARAERATRGWKPGEREAQARARARAKYEQGNAGGPGWAQLSGGERDGLVAAELGSDQPRTVLAVKVRGAAGASRSEAEFVRRLRRNGLLVRPRFADGRTDVITGFSVAERPQAGERPIWYAGGRLARDLTLPRLRDGWEDTPGGAMDAAAEWNAAWRGRRVVAPGREVREWTSDEALAHSRRLAEVVDRLAQVPVQDRDLWATVARQSAGALAAWSNAVEDTPGDLAAAAEALSRSAQTYRASVPPARAGTIAISGAALFLASAARGGQGSVGQAALVREIVTLTDAIIRAAQAARQERHARDTLATARARLERVQQQLPAPPPRPATPPATTAGEHTAPPAGAATVEAPTLDREAQAILDRLRASQAHPATQAASPVPNTIEPARRPAQQQPQHEHDRGR